MVAMAGAPTPAEVITAGEVGSNLVKVVWRTQIGGERCNLALSLLDFVKAGREPLAALKPTAMAPEEE